MINRRGDTWDQVEVRTGEEGGEPYFQPACRLEGLEDEGKVAVFVSTEHKMDLPTIRAYMKRIKEPLVGVVELRTDSRRWLTEENAAAAAAELDAELQGVRTHYPRHNGLVLFVAGPVHLGLMVGRAINFRIHGPCEFPNYVGPDYVSAIQYPPEEVLPRILMLSADPSDVKTIQEGLEIRSIKDMLRMSLGSSGIEPLFETSVTPEHLMYALDRHDPHILHISAHGSKAGDIGLVDERGKLQTAPMEAIVRAIRATAKSLRLVILNACHSAVLAKELAKHIDYVIGTDVPILTLTAIAFAKGLYGGLAGGANLADALERGRSLAALKNLKGADRFHGFAKDGFDPKSWVPYPREDFHRGR